jgi:hypothetical protein
VRVLAMIFVVSAGLITSPVDRGLAASGIATVEPPVVTSDNVNSRLVQVEQVPGVIVDVSPANVLYLDRSDPPVLTLWNRVTGVAEALPSVAGSRHEYGWLTPGGVVLTTSGGEPAIRHLYEWSGGGGLTDLGPTNTYGYPAVRGSFVIWGNLGSIHRRNLDTKKTVLVASHAVDQNDDILENGDVLYWTTDGVQGKFKVMLYHDGLTTTVIRDPVLSDVFPLTDGEKIIYSKLAVVGNVGHSTWIYDQTTKKETQLGDPLFSDLDQGGNYEIRDGWTAFLRPGTPAPQVWVRDPAGAERAISDLGSAQPVGSPRVIAMNSSGQTLYAIGDAVYLGAANRSPLRLAVGLGGWVSHRRGAPSNFATFLSGQWGLAIGGALFVLSSQPLVAVSVKLAGRGTVAISPYGVECRSTCALSFPPGARLRLTATAELPGWRFGGWSGHCSGDQPSCDLVLSGPTSVVTSFTAADTTAPITTTPLTSLPIGVRLSPAAPTRIPLLTSWTTLDPDDAVATDELQVSSNGGEFQSVALATQAAQTARTSGVSATRYQFRARATDSHADVGAWTSGAPFTLDQFAPTILSYAGAWTFTSPPTSWLGTAASTTDPSATATITVAGQDVAIVARTDHNLGALAVYVDDQPRQVVPTAYAGAGSVRIVADLTLGGGTHTIRISPAASTVGAVELQGVIVLR